MNARGLLRLAAVLWTAGGAVALSAAELDEPLRALPATLKLDERKVELGRRLFAEPRLARDNSVSCASCHDFSHGGADPRARSTGVGGAVGAANAPSVFNAGFNFRQLWNGSAAS